MQATKSVKNLPGVKQAVVVMGTELNKTVLDDVKLMTPEAQDAGPGDLIIALEVTSEDTVDAAVKAINQMNESGSSKAVTFDDVKYATVTAAAKAHPGVNLAVISLPGEFAAGEAGLALENGLNAFIFSDNVPLADEVALKKLAEEKGLFVMGPGCGCSVIGGVSLGLMSAVAKGRIGIVGASGSGIHEIAALITQKGLGISQAIGTGGRDLSKEVGGSTMLRGIDYLDGDAATDIIVLVSKPPHPDTASKIYSRVSRCKKPVVIYLLGGKAEEVRAVGAYAPENLEQAAEFAAALAQGRKPAETPYIENEKSRLADMAGQEKSRLAAGQKYVRGIFCGGTHSEETVLILRNLVDGLSSNIAFGGAALLESPHKSVGNCLVDVGDEEFTKGKPHPVMDPTILNDRLIQEGGDPETAVILFDLLLGHGAHPDPVGCIEDTLRTIRKSAEAQGRYVSMVAAITGTQLDPQGLVSQRKRLADIGVRVLETNAQAAVLAGLIAK
ncbi:MAG: hypothetical protein FWH00_05195 [Oscillospiraceae bacterium]|nr:hypothetical protein [Oscillospiraceae bacterium]